MWTISRALARCICSPEQEEAFSEDCFLGGGQCAPSRSADSAGRFSWPDRTTVRSSRSRYGMTCAVSTDARGEDAATSCVAAFLARIYLPWGASPGSGGSSRPCGESSPGSSESRPPSGCSRRTPASSCISGSTSSYGILPRAGTMRNGSVSPRQSLGHPTSGTGYGYSREDESVQTALREAVARLKRGEEATLPEKEFRYLPTPTCSDARSVCPVGQLLRKCIPLSCRLRMLPGGGFYAGGGRANPEYVEWLMAWPMGWTDLSPLATDRLLTWRLGRSPTCGPGSGDGREDEDEDGDKDGGVS